MPLAKPLPVFQQEIREQLVEDLAGALKTLEQLLPAGSEKQRAIITLLGKLNDTNKARLRGTIANEALQLAYNQLRSDLLDLVDSLAESDFDPAAQAPESKKAKQGEILYRIPHAMPLGRETRCLVRIALHTDAIVENITLDEHVTLKSLSRVSDLMQVELLDPDSEPAFTIRAINSAEQFVEEEGYTEWLFQVTPLRAGTFPLMIKVAVIELVLGKERKKEIVLEEVVQISADTDQDPVEAPLKSAGETLVFQEPARGQQSGDEVDLFPGDFEAQTEQPKSRGIDAQAPAAAPVPGMVKPAAPASISTPAAEPAAAPAHSRNPMRTLALFLAFLVLSASATWALAPDEAVWVWTRFVQDTPEAYTAFTQKYPESRHRETAVFRKAEQTNKPADWQSYLNEYQKKGAYIQQAQQALQVLENRAFEEMRSLPTVVKIEEFIATYPQSEKMKQVQLLVDTLQSLQRPEVQEQIKQRVENKATGLLDSVRDRLDQLQKRIISPFQKELLVLVKGGTFDMGDVLNDKEGKDEVPVHPVTLDDFYLGKTEVTFQEYDDYCKATGATEPGDEGWGRNRRPVINISWLDALNYCNWLSEQHGLPKVYAISGEKVTVDWSAKGYRLPTEAEWEYAARSGGKQQRFGNGADIADPAKINFDGSNLGYKKDYAIAGVYRQKTVPVGSLSNPNRLGLHDMAGNVSEWCWDAYDARQYAKDAKGVKNPKGPAKNEGAGSHLRRGGSWFSEPTLCRVSSRTALKMRKSNSIGFRLARTN